MASSRRAEGFFAWNFVVARYMCPTCASLRPRPNE
ncbi:MAG: hypothetical protein JWQ35_2306, partial [Bacteriovoracaceae bacterium]|nr:hypothetical protein [Bacteriovoracaceae bacterium]